MKKASKMLLLPYISISVMLSACAPYALRGKWTDTEGVVWVFKNGNSGRVYSGHSKDEMVYHGYFANGDIFDYDNDDSKRNDNTIPFKYKYSNGKIDIYFSDDYPTYGEWGDEDLSDTHFTGKLNSAGNEIYGYADDIEIDIIKSDK